MKSTNFRVLAGALLLAAGTLLLVENLGWFKLGASIWAFLFMGGGAVFLGEYFIRRENWWAAIPGMTLCGLALVIFADRFLPSVQRSLGGAIFLAAISLAFWLVYFRQRDFWWAVIPAGVLASLTVVAAIGERSGSASGGVLFLGIGATFALVALLPSAGSRFTWAWIPAGVTALLGLMILLLSNGGLAFVMPAVLIAIGLALILRTLFKRN